MSPGHEHQRDGDVDDWARRLYVAPPDGFVPARAAAVAAARKSGDREAARRLAALRKPTVAAWLVNLLALRRPELIDELVELATALRSAQRGLHGEQLRELSTRRRGAVSALVAEARRLAVEVDDSLRGAKLPLAEVETTLTAALADADVASQVRSGRLIRAATYAGFGEVPRPRLRLVSDPDDTDEADETDDTDDADEAGRTDEADGRGIRVPGPGSPAPDGRDARAARRAAEAERAAAERRTALRRRELSRELTAARSGEARARTTLELAQTAESDARHAVAELEAALADLERRRTAAQHDVSRHKLARRAAERDATAARRRVGDVQAALEALDGEPSEAGWAPQD